MTKQRPLRLGPDFAGVHHICELSRSARAVSLLFGENSNERSGTRIAPCFPTSPVSRHTEHRSGDTAPYRLRAASNSGADWRLWVSVEPFALVLFTDGRFTSARSGERTAKRPHINCNRLGHVVSLRASRPSL